MSKQYSDRFKQDAQEFLPRIVTVEETWIHSYSPKAKIQSEQWSFPIAFALK